jgi:hypothetical protein
VLWVDGEAKVRLPNKADWVAGAGVGSRKVHVERSIISLLPELARGVGNGEGKLCRWRLTIGVMVVSRRGGMHSREVRLSKNGRQDACGDLARAQV